MYLEIAYHNAKFGTMDFVAGPFESKEKVVKYKESLKKIVWLENLVTLTRQKCPKGKKLISADDAEYILLLCEIFKKNIS